jgi:hypothetical protein
MASDEDPDPGNAHLSNFLSESQNGAKGTPKSTARAGETDDYPDRQNPYRPQSVNRKDKLGKDEGTIGYTSYSDVKDSRGKRRKDD